MTIRTDIFTIEWSVSPRVIWIDIAETVVDVQDLYDTCKHLEALHTGMDEPYIADAGGKEPLGGGVNVGITVSLFNAVYAFEDRPGPDWVICNMTGGNIVGFEDDTRQVEVYPRKPTAYVSADRSSSSSATLQEQAALQYSSFNGGVTYDATSSYSGTEYPIGTPQQPVNNVYDAADIAAARGFTTGYVIGDLTFPIDLPLDGFTFIGSGKDRTLITIPDAANVSDCTYIDCHITGYLDGENTLKECQVDNLFYIRGFIEQCVLAPGITVLAGTEEAHYLDCWSGQSDTGTHTIDMGGSGQALALRNYNGEIKLINKTGPEPVSIDMNSGQIKLDLTTVVNGTIVCRGIGKLIDATTEESIASGTYGSLVILNELVNVPAITSGIWDALIADYNAAGSFGNFIQKKLLTITKFIGLK